MQGDVRSFITFDFVLWLIFAGMMNVAFVIHILGMHSHDFAPDPASFRIPTDMIADFEPWGRSLGHDELHSTNTAVIQRCRQTIPATPVLGATAAAQHSELAGRLPVTARQNGLHGRQ
jgi:hypothetical protein